MSGRAVVLLFVLAVLVLWGVLFVAMGRWKADHLARAQFGRDRVAPAVDGFASQCPPGVEPDAWARAVADTHQMLVALAASGLLDRPALERLRLDLIGRVRRTRPETALADLAGVWDTVEAGAGPVIAPSGPVPETSRHAGRIRRPPRPTLLGPPSPAAARDL